MKTGIVKFSKEFVTPTGTKEWVGLEMEYDMSTECPRDVLTNAKTIVEQWHKESNSQGLLDNFNNFVPPGPPPIIQKQPEDRAIGLTPELITSCEDVVTLQSFYLLVVKSNRADLKEAYNKRKDELVAKESKEILDTTETLSLLINESGLPYESLDDNK